MLDLYRWIGQRYAPARSVILVHTPRCGFGGGWWRPSLRSVGPLVAPPLPDRSSWVRGLRLAPHPPRGRTTSSLLLNGYVNDRDYSSRFASDLAHTCSGAACGGGGLAVEWWMRRCCWADGDRVLAGGGSPAATGKAMWMRSARMGVSSGGQGGRTDVAHIEEGRYQVVVGTRPAASGRRPRTALVGREHHALIERSLALLHVGGRSVGAGSVRGSCVLAPVMPSLEGLETPHLDVEVIGRRWPRVEAVKPGPEGRAPRLLATLRQARRAFLYEPIRGYGVARVCRACGEPAACASCGGMLRSEEGSIRCTVCEARGRCAACGAEDFGVARGGAERVEQWGSRSGRGSRHTAQASDRPRRRARRRRSWSAGSTR